MNDFKYFIQRYSNGIWETAVDLEKEFSMTFLKAQGLSKKGAAKNIYVETYAETSEIRVSIPENVSKSNTQIVLYFGFVGENRRDNYDRFYEYVFGKRIKYWDTSRKRETELILKDEVEPEKDVLVGSKPYLVVPFKFTNIYGETKKKI